MSNLPDYIRTELAKCQNLKEVATLVAVVRHLAIKRGQEFGNTQLQIASQLGVSKQKVSLLNNYKLKENPNSRKLGFNS